MESVSVPFDEIKGKTPRAIKGLSVGGDDVIFDFTDGSQYRMYHQQDCCESVYIEDVTGDVADLIGVPLEFVEESSDSDGEPPHEYDESWTWTFYKLGTIKGWVDIRWLGTSNGYYGESVGLYRTRGIA